MGTPLSFLGRRVMPPFRPERREKQAWKESQFPTKYNRGRFFDLAWFSSPPLDRLLSYLQGAKVAKEREEAADGGGG